jgi:hypothetical protein
MEETARAGRRPGRSAVRRTRRDARRHGPDVAALARAAEHAALPIGHEERFAGYGVMGIPFVSGHVLAMRRFPASSIGPAYTAVWHRAPTGDWTFWQDQRSELGCGRYFSSEVRSVVETEINVSWPAADELHVAIPAVDLEWRSRMRTSALTRAFNSLGSLLPDRAWRSRRLLRAVGPIAGRMLGTGAITLAGRAPNGQLFVANPQRIWFIVESTATFGGTALGAPGPLRQPAALGEFVIPQKGVFALGRAFFTEGAAAAMSAGGVTALRQVGGCSEPSPPPARKTPSAPSHSASLLA